ncbi:MAG: hypothetical protein VYB44_07265 [Bacteroidota bacterium]|nr:hypothetical protein [Bacteroidota bacterium]
MKISELSLPPFAFLDDQTGEGYSLEGRAVISQPKTGLVFEVFNEDDAVALTTSNFSKTYTYSCAKIGLNERHKVVLHVNPAELPTETVEEISDRLWTWYSAYLKWEDENISTDDSARLN